MNDRPEDIFREEKQVDGDGEKTEDTAEQRTPVKEKRERQRVIGFREVFPSGQDSCQPGPDMTSAEGEAGRPAQPVVVWGVRGGRQGAVQRGVSSTAVHARLWLLSTLPCWPSPLSLSSRCAPPYLSSYCVSTLPAGPIRVGISL